MVFCSVQTGDPCRFGSDTRPDTPFRKPTGHDSQSILKAHSLKVDFKVRFDLGDLDKIAARKKRIDAEDRKLAEERKGKRRLLFLEEQNPGPEAG